MEHLLVKPRYAFYFSNSHKLLSYPGYRCVFTSDQFLAIWKFCVCNEKDLNLNISDKLYKVRPIIEYMLLKFQQYYSPQRMLSIDEGMVPSKNRLSFKQYCKDKPTKWGIKTFILTDSRNGYLYNAVRWKVR